MPFLLLTLLPLGIGACAHTVPAGWAILSVANALFSGGDAILLAIIAWQVPGHAVIRNQGWKSWWKPGELSAASRGE